LFSPRPFKKQKDDRGALDRRVARLDVDAASTAPRRRRLSFETKPNPSFTTTTIRPNSKELPKKKKEREKERH